MGDGVIGRDAVLADLNRPAYANAIVPEWLPQLPDVQARLADATRPARVGDFGCGAGWSTIELAKAYPHLRLDGYDSDEASIAAARRNAAEHGVADRVDFEVVDLSDPAADWSPRYDAVSVRVPARPAAPGRGTGPHATIAQSTRDCHRDGRACGEHFTAPGDPEERFFAACSPLWCVPQGVVGPDPRPIGPLMRPDALRSLAAEAGFSDATVADIEHPFWRFYRLVP